MTYPQLFLPAAPAAAPALYIGLMSGTSMDAVDAALACFDTAPLAPPAGSRAASPVEPGAQSPAPGRPRLLGFASRPLPDGLRDALASLQSSGADELHRAALAANALADLYAATIEDLLHDTGTRPADIAAIGAHGQTVRHRPDLGYTLQLNSPARLAERTGIAVVADFRSRDVAAGGQGAPLACAFHAATLAHPAERRAVVNIGGIANVSLIEPAGRAVTGWDCGPGNVLLDSWCSRHRGERFDEAGRWAASGRVLPGLLARLLAEPYFAAPAPKSTGRDLFHLGWLDSRLRAACPDDTPAATAAPADVQATLLELTAITIADACRAAHPDRVLLCGGGAANDALRERLVTLLAPVPLGMTADEGLPTQAVEALTFAWLARQHLIRHSGNLPAVTGAGGPRVLGALYPA